MSVSLIRLMRPPLHTVAFAAHCASSVASIPESAAVPLVAALRGLSSSSLEPTAAPTMTRWPPAHFNHCCVGASPHGPVRPST